MAAGDSISDASINGITLIPPPPNTLSLVSIKDNHHRRRAGEPDPDPSSLIFPPTHHENLHLKPPPIVSPSSSCSEIVDEDAESSPTASFSPRSGSGSPVIGLGLEVLWSKVKVLLGLRISPAKKLAFAAAAAAVLVFSWWRRRRRRRTESWSRDRVDRIIREKDERIEQLLNQIARMNDLMLRLQGLPAPHKK